MNGATSSRIGIAAILVVLILVGAAFSFYYVTTSSRISDLEQSVSRVSSFESQVSELESSLSSLESSSIAMSTNRTALLESGITPSTPCFNNNAGSQPVSCTVTVNSGQSVVVVLQAVPPTAVRDSANSSFLLLANETHPYTTYYFLVYYVQVWTPGNNGTDTITVKGVGNQQMVSAIPLFGDVKIDNVTSASGSSSTPSVSAYTPSNHAFVFSVMFAPYWYTVASGRGYALIGQYAGIMADEYGTADGSTTSPFEITSGWHDNTAISSGWSDFQQWAEVSVALSCVSRCTAPPPPFHP